MTEFLVKLLNVELTRLAGVISGFEAKSHICIGLKLTLQMKIYTPLFALINAPNGSTRLDDFASRTSSIFRKLQK
jgi:hypothetical protein